MSLTLKFFHEFREKISVPMAPGKYLYPFRTQKSSPVAAIILRKWETSTVPNYIEDHPDGWFFIFLKKMYPVKIALLRNKFISAKYN